MGLPGMNVPWEAPFGYKWLCLQVQLGLFSLGCHIHLVSASWGVGVCH